MMYNLKRIIRRLKHLLGDKVTFYKLGPKVTDYTTGTMTQVKTNITVRRAIFSPITIARNAKSNAPSFKEGGAYDIADATVYVDKLDLGNHEIVIGDFLVYNNRRYDIVEVNIEFNPSIVFLVKETIGKYPEELFSDTLINTLVLTYSIEGSVI